MAVPIWQLFLTGDLERGVAADGTDARPWVGGVAVVRAYVRFTVLVVDDSQEEQLTTRQQHPVRRRVVIGRCHRKSVAIPRDLRRRISFRFAVERGWLVLGHVLAVRVLHYARVARGNGP